MQYLLKMMQSAQLAQNSLVKSLLAPVKIESARSPREKAETEENKENKVEATTNIPPNTISRPISIERIMDDQSFSDDQVSVKVAEGFLEAVAKSRGPDLYSVPSNWFKSIPLSKDCHECNVQLELLDDTSAQLRVVKFIAQGESLKLWFSQELLIALKVPFLSPINIQDEKLYVCNLCDYKCDMPNPLKIHLALNCDAEKIRNLWNRLRSLSAARKTPEKVLNGEHNNHNHELNLSITRRTLTKRNSAFKPYSNYSVISPWFASQPDDRPEVKFCSNDLLVSQMSLATTCAVSPGCNSFLNSGLAYQSAAKHGVLYKDQMEKNGVQLFQQQAAEIETFISNLGKSKQGHLCIYCGKTYSRKYGLKIHIRTHTGFKPLKCKYCLRPFGDPSNLNKHIRLHAGGKTPYKCDLCGKVLVRRRDLEKHIRSRHYTC